MGAASFGLWENNIWAALFMVSVLSLLVMLFDKLVQDIEDLHLRYRDKIVTVDGIALLFDEPEQNSTSSSSEPIEKK